MDGRARGMLAIACLGIAFAGCGSGTSKGPLDIGADGLTDPGGSPDVPLIDPGVDVDAVGPRDVAGDAADVPVVDVPPDDQPPTDVPADVPSPDIADDPSVDLPADAVDDVFADLPADVPAEDPGDVGGPETQEDVAADLPSDPGTDPGPLTCAVGNGGCSPNALCVDGSPHPDCYCNAGYTGDGLSCTDINECDNGIGNCDANATCHNLQGSHKCICNLGYEGSGASCTDINECAQTPSPCGLESSCTNTEGSYQCSCDLGAAVDGHSCRWGFEVIGGGQETVKAVVTDAQLNTYVLMGTDGAVGGSSYTPGGLDMAVARYDYQGHRDWARSFGSIGTDYPGGIAVDAARNVYVAGTAGAGFGGAASNGSVDAFVMKITPVGDIAWLVFVGTAAYEGGTGIAVYGDSVFVSGYTNGVFGGQASAGMTDAFLARIDMDGNTKWVRQFGSNANERATAVAVGASGQIFVAGWTEGVLGSGSSAGSMDGFLATFDVDGNAGWVREFGTNANEEITAVAADPASGAWVVGSTGGTFLLQTGKGGTDAFVTRYDTTGTQTLLTQFGTTGSDVAYGVAADATGAWVVATVGGALGSLANLGGNDAAVLRFDTAGTLGQAKILGTASEDEGSAITVANDGSLRVAIQTWGDLGGGKHSGDPDAAVVALDSGLGVTWAGQTGSNVWTVGSRIILDAADDAYVLGATVGNVGGGLERTWGSDVFLTRVKSNGQVAWRRQYGTAFDERAAGIALGSAAVVVVGSSTGLPDGSSSPNGQDVFLAPYGLDGTAGTVVTWGTSASDQAKGAVGDAAGNVYVVGMTWGSLDATNAGLADMFAVRFGPDLKPVWAHQMGTTLNDSMNAVALHPDGGIVATGMVIAPLAGAVSAGGPTGSGGVVVVRYDADGNRLWLVTVGDAYSDSGEAIAVDADGDVYVAGTTYGAIADTAMGGTDLFVMRLSGIDGSVMWAHQFGTSGQDSGHGIALGPDGSVYVIGQVDGVLAGTSDGTTAQGGQDAVVVRLDADGVNVALWQIGTTQDDSGEGIAVDSGGNRLILGWTKGDFELAVPNRAESLFLMKR